MKAPLTSLATQAAKHGLSVQRFKISRVHGLRKLRKSATITKLRTVTAFWISAAPGSR